MDERAIGIIGGTGPQGRGLALRLALTRQRVRVGSRDAARGESVAKELNALLGAEAPGLINDATFHWIEGGSNAAVVAQSDIVMLTVPFESAVATLQGIQGSFRPGALFVDVTVPLQFGKGEVQMLPLPEGSGSAHLRKLVPAEVPFVGACKTLPAHLLERLDLALDCNIMVYGDDKAARSTVIDVLSRIPHLRPLDVGGMSAAPVVEGMTMLLVRINRRYSIETGRFAVVGLGGEG